MLLSHRPLNYLLMGLVGEGATHRMYVTPPRPPAVAGSCLAPAEALQETH